MRFKVTEGPIERAQRVLVYGPEGIGKSTFASQMPNPLFIDVEEGTGHLYVRRYPTPPNWEVLIDECRSVSEQPGDVSTLVIDSADAAERLCQMAVCKTAKKPSIESWGYGRGYVIAAEEFQKLLDVLDNCIAVGVNVMLIAHSQMRKFERPDEAGTYDRFEVKLNKHVASKIKEWADAVLFLDYETFVSVDDNGKGKASGGKRVGRTSHDVSWDAKNRWGLPDKLKLDADGIAKVMAHLPVRDADQPRQATATEAKPEPKHPNAELLRDMADKATRDKAEAKAKDPKPMKAKSAPDRLAPLFDACKQSKVNPFEDKSVLVARSKRKESQAITDWEQPFVQWVIKNWARVCELVEQDRKDGKIKKYEDVYDVDIPF